MAPKGRTLTVYLAADTKQAATEIQGFAGKVKSVMGPAFLAAAAAAGAFAVSMAVEGVEAAAAEEAELAKLNQTLTNLGWADATGDVMAFADQLARATTFDDTAIRSAFANIAQSAPDAATAMDAVTVAVDAAVGANKDLDSVTLALQKAYAGNTTALSRMFPWLDKNRLATEGMDYATEALADRFTGQASAAADTWTGKLGNTAEAFDELKESFGKGFLDALGESETGTGDLTTALYDLQPALEELGGYLGTLVGDLGEATGNILELWQAIEDLRSSLEDTPWGKIIDAMLLAFRRMASPLEGILALINGIADAIRNLQNMSLPDWLPGDQRSLSPAAATRSMSPAAFAAGAPINVTVQAGIGDPIAIARTIERTLATARLRTGRPL